MFPLQQLLQILSDHGIEGRYVGGCVRNYLLGLPLVMDYDLAVDAPPEKVIEILNQYHIKNIPTGISHGTITALYQGYICEITSLREDVITDGRHAQVSFTKDWYIDASRRDFTINAIYYDIHGNFFDPWHGMEDLKAGKIKFIEDAEQRIQEDFLRILRFFRFFSHFGAGELDQTALNACFKYKDSIKSLAKERIGQEFKKILRGKNKLQSIKSMEEAKILDVIFEIGIPLEADKIDRFVKYCKLNKLDHSDLLPLAFFNIESPQSLKKQLALSNNEIKYLEKFLKYQKDPNFSLIYLREGSEFTKDFGLWYCTELSNPASFHQSLMEQKFWQIKNPSLPINGKDLLKLGMQSNPNIGKVLSKVEEWWAANDFQPNQQSCLDYAKGLKDERF